MTPKEKAIELVDKYANASFNCKGCEMPFCTSKCTMLSLYETKECALIAVDEIIKNLVDLSNGEFAFIFNVQYWQEVKQEIENL